MSCTTYQLSTLALETHGLCVEVGAVTQVSLAQCKNKTNSVHYSKTFEITVYYLKADTKNDRLPIVVHFPRYLLRLCQAKDERQELNPGPSLHW